MNYLNKIEQLREPVDEYLNPRSANQPLFDARTKLLEMNDFKRAEINSQELDWLLSVLVERDRKLAKVDIMRARERILAQADINILSHFGADNLTLEKRRCDHELPEKWHTILFCATLAHTLIVCAS